MSDSILEALKRIEDKQDCALNKQDEITASLEQIKKDCKRISVTNGLIGGTCAGGLITIGIELIRLKFGG